MVGSSEKELHPPPVRGCVWASYGELDGGAILGTFSVAPAPAPALLPTLEVPSPAMRRMCAWRKLGRPAEEEPAGCLAFFIGGGAGVVGEVDAVVDEKGRFEAAWG
jgi:hypothetical protein